MIGGSLRVVHIWISWVSIRVSNVSARRMQNAYATQHLNQKSPSDSQDYQCLRMDSMTSAYAAEQHAPTYFITRRAIRRYKQYGFMFQKLICHVTFAITQRRVLAPLSDRMHGTNNYSEEIDRRRPTCNILRFIGFGVTLMTSISNKSQSNNTVHTESEDNLFSMCIRVIEAA